MTQHTFTWIPYLFTHEDLFFSAWRWPMLSLEDSETLVHAFITSCLAYCNFLYFGISGNTVNRLQHIKNSAARVLIHTKHSAHIKPVLQELHGLPVSQRINSTSHLQSPTCPHPTLSLWAATTLHPCSDSQVHQFWFAGSDQEQTDINWGPIL